MLPLVVMTVKMAATASVSAEMTARVTSEEAVSPAETSPVRTSAEALRRMPTAKQVVAA